MATAKSPNPNLHAIMISLHLQGHISPFHNLAISLASTGFSISFAHFDFIHHRISNSRFHSSQIDIFAQARASGLDIRYFTLTDGFPPDFDREANSHQYLHSFIHRLPDIVDEFVGNIIQSSPHSNYFLIADTFSIWASKVANKYKLVNVSFWTEPALVFSLYYHLDLLRRNGAVPVNGRRENVDYIPGVPSINTKDFASYLHDSNLELLHQLVFGAFDLVKSADFVLCNTVEELETDCISALQETAPFNFYPIGPLFPADSCNIATSLLPESDCSEWLNSKPAGSVLYISFGSLSKVDKKLICEIAGGLLIAGVQFLWALRPGMVDSDSDGEFQILPEGFDDRVDGRGIIVPWCNQTQVLGNPAIGGFLTHCGWNSILESVWNGVPMICYPLFTDQITNRKLVVDDWRVGMNLCDGDGISEEEVAEKIGDLMNRKKEELKMGIEKVRKILQNSLAENGSSVKNLDRFVRELSERVQR